MSGETQFDSLYMVIIGDPLGRRFYMSILSPQSCRGLIVLSTAKLFALVGLAE